MDTSKYEAVRANITETISLLDELKSKTTQGEWSKISTLSVWVDDEPYGQDGNEEFIIALHNNYSALRQAALDGERYRKAGEGFMSAVQSITEKENIRLGNVWKAFMNSPYSPEFLTPMEALSEESRKKLQELYCAAEAYRQAVEEK